MLARLMRNNISLHLLSNFCRLLISRLISLIILSEFEMFLMGIYFAATSLLSSSSKYPRNTVPNAPFPSRLLTTTNLSIFLEIQSFPSDILFFSKIVIISFFLSVIVFFVFLLQLSKFIYLALSESLFFSPPFFSLAHIWENINSMYSISFFRGKSQPDNLNCYLVFNLLNFFFTLNSRISEFHPPK